MSCDSCNIPSDAIIYSGPNLLCIDVDRREYTTVAIQKAEQTLCELQTAVNILQQQVNILFPPITTTTSTSSTTTFFSTTTTTTTTPIITTTTTTLFAPAGLRVKLNVASGGTVQNNVSVWYSITNGGAPVSWTLLNSGLTVPVCPTEGIYTNTITTSIFPCYIHVQVIQGASRTNVYNVGYNTYFAADCQTPGGYTYTHINYITNGFSGIILDSRLTIKWPLDVVGV